MYLAMISLVGVPGALPVLAKPVLIEAAGKPIATDIGHADPWVYDFNGDGKKDLLVGQYEGGKLRIYLNEGTDKDPKFGSFKYLQVAGKEASVPPS